MAKSVFDVYRMQASEAVQAVWIILFPRRRLHTGSVFSGIAALLTG